MTTQSKPEAVAPDSTSDQTSPQKPVARSRRPLIVAFAIAGVWISALLVLALTTANPVTLNRKQIRESDYVVTAKRTDPGAQTLEVLKEWKRGEELETVTIANLDRVELPADREFLVPLNSVGSGRYRITKTTLPNRVPLIYPATEEAKSQLAAILKDDTK